MPRRHGWADVALLALSTTLGAQTLRVVVPSFHYVLYGRLRLAPALVAIAGGAVVAAAVLLPALDRWLGRRRTIALCSLALGGARLGIQAWTGDTAASTALAATGTAAFFVLLPALVATETSGARTASALLLGLTLDTALQSAFLTYDYAWQHGAVPLALAILLAVAHGVALGAFVAPERDVADRPPTARALAWAALGCALFLEVTVFQNTARLATFAERPLPVAMLATVLGLILGVGMAAWSAEIVRRTGWIVWAAVLVASLLPVYDPGLLVVSIVAGHAALGLLLARVVESRPAARPMRFYDCAKTGLALAGLVGLFFAPLGLRLPFSSDAALLLAAAGVVYGAARAPAAPAVGAPWWSLPIALVAAVVPGLVALRWHEPAAAPPRSGGPVRVVSFNIHKGFDTDGRLGLEALAAAIEAEAPDVIALQEVSRGQLFEGNVDVASWLSERLDLPCLYAPSGAGLWGQSILTRFPVIRAENHLLPPFDLPTARSYSVVELATGDAGPLRVFNTHYTAVFGHEARRAHSEALAAAVASGPLSRTIVVGDFNATPDSPPMRLLFDAGLVDAIKVAGLEPGYTAPSVAPTVRIDYVLHSPDLAATDVRIRPTLASDHFLVAATIGSDGDFTQRRRVAESQSLTPPAPRRGPGG